ncbi:hypothetical protein ACFUN7_32190 [Streptomyces sp. NPDC057236]|uniref:hypothetical protein n=1 Tax=Streptomyces sp. NPDC057236 TaxID=3346059 RepID=UPI003629A5C0
MRNRRAGRLPHITGCTVDAADFTEGALERARAEHPEADEVRRLCLDVEHGDLTDLAEDGFEHAERFDAHGLAVLLLRGPAGSFSA